LRWARIILGRISSRFTFHVSEFKRWGWLVAHQVRVHHFSCHYSADNAVAPDAQPASVDEAGDQLERVAGAISQLSTVMGCLPS
jgi:hypothetical protein